MQVMIYTCLQYVQTYDPSQGHSHSKNLGYPHSWTSISQYIHISRIKTYQYILIHGHPYPVHSYLKKRNILGHPYLKNKNIPVHPHSWTSISQYIHISSRETSLDIHISSRETSLDIHISSRETSLDIHISRIKTSLDILIPGHPYLK